MLFLKTRDICFLLSLGSLLKVKENAGTWCKDCSSWTVTGKEPQVFLGLNRPLILDFQRAPYTLPTYQSHKEFHLCMYIIRDFLNKVISMIDFF